MTTFIESCKCKGKPPRGIAVGRHTLRPHLIGAMLKEREAPRFLIGPKGYGKTSVALEYAQTIFEYSHVLWIRCDSPCFLRDLDTGMLFELVMEADPSVQLIVCDDLPILEDTRLELFASFLKSVLDSGCETVSTCAPSQSLVAYEMDGALRISPSELLLADDELERECALGNSALEGLREISVSDRAAALIWGKGGKDELLYGIRDESIPLSLRFAIFEILLFESGDLSVLNLSGRYLIHEQDLAFLEESFPYLGIDRSGGSFLASKVSCDDLRDKGGFSLSEFVDALEDKHSLKILFKLASILMGEHKDDRACEFMRTFATRAMLSRWVALNGMDLLMRCEARSVLELAEYSRKGSGDVRPVIDVVRAWSLLALGEDGKASDLRDRLISSSDGGWLGRCVACVLGLSPQIDADVKELLEVLDVGISMLRYDNEDVRAYFASNEIDWIWLLRSVAMLQMSSDDPSVALDGVTDLAGEGEQHLTNDGERLAGIYSSANAHKLIEGLKGADEPRKLSAACLVSSWMLGRLVASENAELPSEWVDVAEELAGILDRATEDDPQGLNICEWAWVQSAAVVKNLAEMKIVSKNISLSEHSSSLLRLMTYALGSQQSGYRKNVADSISKKNALFLTHPDSPRYDKALQATKGHAGINIPTLDINMFGGLEVKIGDEEADPKLLSRKKTKIALAILMLGKGREISKERVTSVLWPDADAESRQRNFYAIWSDLKRALSIDCGCPYLIRSQTGYKLDRRYVSSDIDDFDDLCHNLMFGRDDMDAWRDLFHKASDNYSQDLLSGIDGNEYIDDMRTHCRTQLADGLVAAAKRMSAQGEFLGSIWFAREALKRAPVREDAYITIMDAQIESDQRGAALETYFDCRRNLSEKLGIDPSARVMELYRSIIESEENI